MRTVTTDSEVRKSSEYMDRRFVKLADKCIRAATAPNVMAMLLTTMMYIKGGAAAFADRLHYVEAMFTLGVLPMAAYLLCGCIPALRKKGRKFERTLAIVFSVMGYVMGTAFSVLGGGTMLEHMLFFTYLISGTLTALCSFAFNFKASGHTCGVSGPAAMMTYCFGTRWMMLFLLLIPVSISSIRLGRHTWFQLATGAVIPIVAMLIASRVAGLIV